MNLADIRKDYKLRVLTEQSLATTPFIQLHSWLEDAIKADVNEPTAMNIATADKDGQPSARIVLLKAIENGMLKFFTNYESKKGSELACNPKAAVTFFWPELERQVRWHCIAHQLPDAESDTYFFSRPIDSQIGAIASPQSKIIEGREVLEQNVQNIGAHYLEEKKRPIFWGGYGLVPFYCEFWQGRSNRLHDRLVYELSDGVWKTFRLAP